MKKVILLLSVLLVASGLTWAQSRTPSSLAEVARKVRAQRIKKDLSKVPLFTNDNIPKAGAAVSTVGSSRVVAAAEGEPAAEEEAGAGKEGEAEECDEQCWRERFREKRQQIRSAQRELDILQREYNLARVQYYQDPNRAMREQYSANTAGGRELLELQRQMSEKRTEIQRLQQELSQLEDDLRRSGGSPSWARE